jgi:hypothetical protein
MKPIFPVVFACVIAIMLLAAGCTQTTQPPPTLTPVPTAVPTQAPTAVPTPVPTTPTPVPTTIAPAVPLPVSVKDTPLLFTISAPAGYTGTTIRAKTSDYSSLYKTTVFYPSTSGTNASVNDNSGNYSELSDSLTIFSYSSSYSVDQMVRTNIRNAGVPFNESAVTYNNIAYTRFDVTSDPFTKRPGETVVFVGDKASANERGFLPVIIYTMTPDGTLSKATYENMVKSFSYFPGRTIGSVPGTETDRPSFYQ